MAQWVITVAAVAILSVLCDVILPEGQTRKYVKTVFGVVVTLVIVQPLIGLVTDNDSWFSFNSGEYDDVQQQYIESVDARQNANAADSVKKLLEYNDISVSKITVSNLDKSVTIELNESHTGSLEDIVRLVVSSYFPDYEIISIWK